ncbi:uncharacterized protein BDR25DRAFT_355207 [Lindgomyces ingoldianus]|uniref:Uncharacterized protein n=1 Tax=Lindgomyces ingoldianus TaxID=673940 RepID=A0ACB6QUM8_9PLEO|nr:uncharacterized protein BDR25DRAFT_355207 [Lindgomyces ingoldianus]KAF2470749.1 hypothetical protein BDR25DRAFT_355207 [Lindgomyces ingoldianus]
MRRMLKESKHRGQEFEVSIRCPDIPSGATEDPSGGEKAGSDPKVHRHLNIEDHTIKQVGRLTAGTNETSEKEMINQDSSSREVLPEHVGQRGKIEWYEVKANTHCWGHDKMVRWDSRVLGRSEMEVYFAAWVHSLSKVNWAEVHQSETVYHVIFCSPQRGLGIQSQDSYSPNSNIRKVDRVADWECAQSISTSQTCDFSNIHSSTIQAFPDQLMDITSEVATQTGMPPQNATKIRILHRIYLANYLINYNTVQDSDFLEMADLLVEYDLKDDFAARLASPDSNKHWFHIYFSILCGSTPRLVLRNCRATVECELGAIHMEDCLNLVDLPCYRYRKNSKSPRSTKGQRNQLQYPFS